MVKSRESSWRWVWMDPLQKETHSSSGCRQYGGARIQRADGFGRNYSLGDTVVVNAGKEVWIAQILALHQETKAQFAKKRKSRGLKATVDRDLDKYPEILMRCTFRWFEDARVFDNGERHRGNLPHPVPEEYYVSSQVEQDGLNSLFEVIGRAWIFETELEREKFEDDPDLEYLAEYDRLCVVRGFARMVRNRTIRTLVPGELLFILQNPSKDKNLYHNAPRGVGEESVMASPAEIIETDFKEGQVAMPLRVMENNFNGETASILHASGDRISDAETVVSPQTTIPSLPTVRELSPERRRRLSLGFYARRQPPRQLRRPKPFTYDDDDESVSKVEESYNLWGEAKTESMIPSAIPLPVEESVLCNYEESADEEDECEEACVRGGNEVSVSQSGEVKQPSTSTGINDHVMLCDYDDNDDEDDGDGDRNGNGNGNGVEDDKNKEGRRRELPSEEGVERPSAVVALCDYGNDESEDEQEDGEGAGRVIEKAKTGLNDKISLCNYGDGGDEDSEEDCEAYGTGIQRQPERAEEVGFEGKGETETAEDMTKAKMESGQETVTTSFDSTVLFAYDSDDHEEEDQTKEEAELQGSLRFDADCFRRRPLFDEDDEDDGIGKENNVEVIVIDDDDEEEEDLDVKGVPMEGVEGPQSASTPQSSPDESSSRTLERLRRILDELHCIVKELPEAEQHRFTNAIGPAFDCACELLAGGESGEDSESSQVDKFMRELNSRFGYWVT